tara:strand:+ start:112 stop:354 length:243 start_codon:yes stop_codon:yes gene_type:complete
MKIAEFDVYYTKTKEDWDKGLNTEFDTTHNSYEKAVKKAKRLGKDNYLVEINIVDEPSKFIVLSKNNKVVLTKNKENENH